MTDARRFNRLQAGDTFRFVDRTILELQPNKGPEQRRYVDALEEFIVLQAGPTTGGDRMGSYADNGGWYVWAAPKGSALEDLHARSLTFYQDGPYQAYALVKVILIEAAKPREYRLTAVSA